MRTPLRLIALSLLALQCGCASSPWQRETLYSKEGFVLYREEKVLDGRRLPLGYKHPVVTDAETVAHVLARLAYRTDPLIGDSKDQLLFTPAEVREFAEPFALALATLTPDQRLRFVVIRDRWTVAFTGPRAISGAMFAEEEGRLEIALDRLVERVQLGDDGSAEDVHFPAEPTEFTEVDEPLLTFPGAVLHTETETGRTFGRWLAVTLADVPPLETGDAATATTASQPPGGNAPVSPAQPDESYDALRRRIETLKRLRADGAITAEEYQAQFDKTMAEMTR